MLDYYYQDEAVDECFDYLEAKPENHPLIVAPTGSGKSHIIAKICERILKEDSKVLVLSHVKEILLQDEEKLRALLPKGKVGLYSAGAKRRERRHVTVAGIQSVYEKAYLFEDYEYVIVDEAHLIPPEGEGRYLTLLKSLDGVTVIGLTATPYRLGTGSLVDGPGKMFDDIVYDIDIVQLIKEGYLCPLRTVDAEAAFNTRKIKKQGGDFQTKDMSRQFDKYVITKEVVKELVTYKDERKSWLVFAIDIEHATHIHALLKDHGINAGVVHSKRLEKMNDKVTAAYRNGELQALVSVAKMTTGFDDPKTDLIALVRPTASPVLHVQMIGRGLRTHPDKEDCLILDFAGNLMRLGPINDVVIKVKGKGGGVAPIKACPECRTHVPASARKCYICGYEFPQLESADLTNRASSEEAVVDRSKMDLKQAWHTVDTVHYHEHVGKRGNSLCITYRCGLRVFKKWIAIGREGRGGMHAKYWWDKNSRFRNHEDYRPPETLEEALTRARKGELDVPREIFVSEVGDYPEITSYRYSRPADADAVPA